MLDPWWVYLLAGVVGGAIGGNLGWQLARWFSERSGGDGG